MSTMRKRSKRKELTLGQIARLRDAPDWATGVPRDAVLRYDVPFLGKHHYGNFVLRLHADSTILCLEEAVSEDDRSTVTLAMFVLSHLREPLEERSFLLVGTGDRVNLPEIWNHIASKQSRSGYMWHLFEVWP